MPQDTQQGTGEGSRQSADAANELIFHLFAASRGAEGTEGKEWGRVAVPSAGA